MKFLDLFAGIGGFRMGLESLGHECVGFCEIDKFARKSYKAIYDTEGEIELHDITQVTNEEWRNFRGTVDIICGGFPCQAFSIAGKRKGFLDETRGTLFFEIARAAKEIKPPLLFLENVKGLLSHDKGRTFRTILSTLDELGYDAEWQIFNSKDFGVPQNRERVYIIGHLRGAGGRPVFPIRGENPTFDSCKPKRLGNINPSGKGEGSKIAIPVLTPDRAKKRQNGRRFKTDREPMFTLTAQDRHGVMIRVCEATKKGYAEAAVGDYVNLEFPNSKTRRGRVGKQVANTLLTSDNQGVVTETLKIRKLTPRECWRLQGFPDWAFDKAQEVNSNSQLYKQAGNSVTVNVIKAIAERLDK
ncbi:MAG TPA: DNA cytosine methyltransferase [Candidatus Atopostipes pullistercoris]|uniref:Cytosine-specific methyltransferase n=1 Tax=Candidatus Atopostipes pullistercoris TaxID=2838467 RepID=A0A9D2G2H7_9LACT|nr:DNA cytosine methyltransferase [Candidatus Atopostipes pullistercoris]